MKLYESEAIKQRIIREGLVSVQHDLQQLQERGITLTHEQLCALVYHRIEQSLTIIEAEARLGICPELQEGERYESRWST